jgi:hypothetical protein
LTRLVGEEQREAEVFINNVTIYADDARESLVYDLTLQAGQMPDAQMSSVSLFVDSGGSGDKCWPADISGVGSYQMPCEATGVLVCAPTYGWCSPANDIDDFNRIADLIDDGKYYITVPKDLMFDVLGIGWTPCDLNASDPACTMLLLPRFAPNPA